MTGIAQDTPANIMSFQCILRRFKNDDIAFHHTTYARFNIADVLNINKFILRLISQHLRLREMFNKKFLTWCLGIRSNGDIILKVS